MKHSQHQKGDTMDERRIMRWTDLHTTCVQSANSHTSVDKEDGPRHRANMRQQYNFFRAFFSTFVLSHPLALPFSFLSEEAAQAQNDEKFDAEHLVCGGCVAGDDAKNCAKHGKEFVEFKCKFCCVSKRRLTLQT